MMPFLYPTRPTAFPILVIGNQNPIEDEEGEEEEEEEDFDNSFPSSTMDMVSQILANFVNMDEQILPSPSIDQNAFRLRMNVDGFQPNELNISIRHGRLIIRGKHIVRASIPSLTTDSMINDNDDTEPDFVAKEFKRTFIIPPNTDVRKAHAQFYPHQQLLMIEIPYQNSVDPSETRINRIGVRPIDIFLAIVTILSMDRVLHRTYERFLANEEQTSNRSNQVANRRQSEHDNILF